MKLRVNVSLIMVLLALFFYKSTMAQDSMGSIKVSVKDFYSSTPVVGAQVTITPCEDSGITDFNGEFVLDPVTPSRNYQIDVEADGYIKQSVGFVTVAANQQVIAHVPMKQESTITGAVTDSTSPVADVAVILGNYESDGGSTYFVAMKSAITDSNGSYTLENVDEGSYKLIALADEYIKNMVAVETVAGENLVQNFSLTWQGTSATSASIILRTSLDGDPLPLPTYKGKQVYIDGRGSTDAVNFFWLKEEIPPGSEPLGQDYYLGESKVYSFIVPASGNYRIKLFVDDSSGIIDGESITFSAVNVAPEAVPSIIPGPSELPYLYNNQVYSSTAGTASVLADSTVYLRGLGIDINLPSPEEFNPDASCFDIYENKNGNFSASIFDYSWTLKDKNDADLTYLLNPSATSENVSFTIPSGAQAGDYFTATLTVTDDEAAVSDPVDVTIKVAETTSCTECHEEIRYGYAMHPHVIVGTGCQNCHGPGSVHIADPSNNKLSFTYWSGVCGQCHLEFAEMQKANHSDPLPFGYFEPFEGRLTYCYKCHYTKGYIGAVEQPYAPFQEFSYYPSTPLSEVPKDTPNITCSSCHEPHGSGLRTGAAETACDTCHYEKWQNVVLEGAAGQFGSAYHYPGEDYSQFLGINNPHRTTEKCVRCHMSTALEIVDENGVRKIGGHTFRMRDYGDDQVPETADDILNIAVCEDCHQGVTNFDRNGEQSAIKEKLTTLSDMLKGANHGFLPANEPGKCARCHMGGTDPFPNDTYDIREHAYTNYKLILNDRSWGIHNPGYVNKLLQDSIDNVYCEGNFDCDADQDGSDAATFKSDFGRSQFKNPCTNSSPCAGDFDCDKDVDGTDASLFKSDFGRTPLNNPCPSCETEKYCVYP